MSRVLLSAALLSLLAVTAASPAIAKVDPDNCEAPDLITLVARGPNGAADPIGTFTVILRDRNNVPDENEPVTLDFHYCADIRLCSDQRDPGLVVDCVARTVSGRSSPDGRVTFCVIGCATNLGASPGSIGPALEIYSDGILLKAVRVAVLDQNGGGLTGGDLSLVLNDYLSAQPFARSDYDGDGLITGNDLSLWLAAYFAGGSAVSGGGACP